MKDKSELRRYKLVIQQGNETMTIIIKEPFNVPEWINKALQEKGKRLFLVTSETGKEFWINPDYIISIGELKGE